MEIKEILKNAVKVLDSKKAENITALKITDLTVVADYFIIATSTASTHIRALADEVEDALSKAGVKPGHTEGRTTGWILLDYGALVIHIFTADQREHFNLEHLWADAETVDISEMISE